MILAVVPVGVLALWELGDAATTDTAAASVDRASAAVGEPITFTSTNPCTTACSLTWRRPDIGLVRFGGVVVGRGEQFSMSFAAPGSYQVVLDMGETCDGTSRLVCHSYASVFVDIVDPVVVPDPVVPVDPVVVPDPVVPVDPVVVPDPVVPVDPVVVPDPVVTPDPVVVPDPVALQLVAPSDLTVTTIGGRTRLTWTNPDTTATSAVLERCKGTGCTSFRQLATLTTDTTSFIESRIKRSSTSYSYRLAVSDGTDTVYSSIAVAAARR
ncbi:MAG: PKD domain-containing protein [Ilumatobacteraceae bacterium]